ncbi:MAG: hypothetical protein NC184_06185 [Roseburia sp.]|nr:hypothetical protein [Roseburia sp.]
MAKKIVTQTDGTETPEERDARLNSKRKHKKCCTCCLVFVIVLVVILAAAFGVGWYFGDKYTKEYLDMSLGDTLGVVSDLYWTKDKHVVKNPYSDSDLDDFYAQIKKNLLLKEDADIDFETALSSAMDSFLSAGVDGINGEGSAQAALRNAAEGDGDGQSDDGDKSVTDALVDMFVGIITRDNIDVTRLHDYSETNDEYIFELQDRGLAAFTNEMLKAVLSNAQKIDALKDFADVIDFNDAVALKQIRFKAESSENEVSEQVMTATVADITVWIGLQKTAGSALKYFLDDAGVGWLGGVAGFMGNVILPKNLYATVSVPLHGDAEPQVTLNKMNASERDRAYKLVNGVLNMSGSSKTLQDYMTDFADKMQPYLEAASDKMDFSASAQGVINLDLIDAMVKMANKSIAGEEPLTKSDFMYMLQAVIASDADARLAEIEYYLYKDWYVDGAGAYRHAPSDTSGMTPVDYEREFVNAIESAYSVNFGDDATLSDVLDMLGISLDGSSATAQSKDLIDLIDSSRLRASLDRPESELKLRVTDRMLGAALSGKLDSALKNGNNDFGGLNVMLDALTFVEAEPSNGHTYALIAAEVDFDELVASLEGDILSKLAASILPEKVLLSITVDVTLSPAAGFEYAPASYMINDCHNTDNVLDTLGKLIPGLSFDSMTGEIETMLRDMLKELDKTLDIEIVTSKVEAETTTSGQLVLPSIFEFVSNSVLLDDNDEKIVSSSELINVLKGLNDTAGFDDTPKIAADYSEFMKDVTDKYYLAPTQQHPLDTFDDLTTFISADGFDASKFRMEGDDPQGKYLIYDTRGVDELKPVMCAAELGALMADKILTGDGDISKFKLIEIQTTRKTPTTPPTLTVVMSVKIDELMPDKVQALIDEDYMYVTVTADVSEPINGAYPVSVDINNMDSETFAAAMKIVRNLGDGFDIEEQVSEFGKILYEQMSSLEESLGGDGFMTFTDDGIELAGFYEYLVNKLELKDGDDPASPASPDTAKRALQGMYPQSDVPELSNPNNYAVTGELPEFIINHSTVTEYPTGTQMSDIRFNGFFQSALVNNDTATGVTTMQTIALGNADTSDEAKYVRDWLNAALPTALRSGKDYLVVTFAMAINKTVADGETDSSNGFMPNTVYATIALEHTDSGEYELAGFAMNGMDKSARAVILQIMNVSDDANDDGKINISSVINASLGDLNDLISRGGSVEVAPQFGGEGIGSIIFGIAT